MQDNSRARRAYGVPSVNTDFAYDNLGRVTDIDAGSGLVKFAYSYVDDENNLYRKTFDHRSGSPYNQYSYDDLDRLTGVTYHDSDTEAFAMDDLGNRDGNQALRDDGTVNFVVDDDTNRYTSIGGNSITHDDAGNMTQDKDGYDYTYDYENRIVKIEDSLSNTVATFDYDALGRRIRKVDSVASETTLYYYNPDWQCLEERNGSDVLQRSFVYGNYIDEVLLMDDGSNDYYYLQDHLYSVVALIGYVSPSWVVVERYEYDAYGKMTWFDPDFTTWSGTEAGNPYYFTGRRLDELDHDSMEVMYYRHRYFDPYAGRFLQHDPLEINTIVGENIITLRAWYQFPQDNNLYVYADCQPINLTDAYGLMPTKCCKELLPKLLQHPNVMPYYDKALKAKDMDMKKCLKKIECGTCSNPNNCGSYNSISRKITLCTGDGPGWNLVVIRATIIHELVHAIQCDASRNCSHCMKKELAAYFFSGACAGPIPPGFKNREEFCLSLAWNSCKGETFCTGKNWNQFVGKFPFPPNQPISPR